MWIVVLLNESGAPCGNRDEDLLLTQRERGIILVMNTELPIIYLARHGETARSLTGQHTGLTDLPLARGGERNARALGVRLHGLNMDRVFTSSLLRARRTCELAGFCGIAEADRDLVEWNYGQYEGLRTSEIHAKRPDWQLFRDGCPGGESPSQVGTRADRVLSRLRAGQERIRAPGTRVSRLNGR